MPPRRPPPPPPPRAVSLRTAACWLAGAVALTAALITVLAHRLLLLQATTAAGPGSMAAAAGAAMEAALGDLLVGRRDWALSSAGGRVTAHSPLAPGVAPFEQVRRASRGGGGSGLVLGVGAGRQTGGRDAPPADAVHPLASQWLLSPAPGGIPLPGRCLPLAGSSGGWVEVSLRQPPATTTPPVISSMTLEAPPPELAFDEGARALPAVLAVSLSADGGVTWAEAGVVGYEQTDVDTSARVGGGRGSLGALAQTTRLSFPGPANAVRLQVVANFGHPEWTCLYRVRVHAE